jgi:hypothetical protein
LPAIAAEAQELLLSRMNHKEVTPKPILKKVPPQVPSQVPPQVPSQVPSQVPPQVPSQVPPQGTPLPYARFHSFAPWTQEGEVTEKKSWESGCAAPPDSAPAPAKRLPVHPTAAKRPPVRPTSATTTPSAPPPVRRRPTTTAPGGGSGRVARFVE